MIKLKRVRLLTRSEAISQERFDENWKHVKYQLELEGFHVTEKDKEVMRKVAIGEKPRKYLSENL